MLIKKSLNILCFGDSITAGWSHGGTVYHPYADSMLASLKKGHPSINFTADVQGLPGDQVTSPPGGFLPRMDILYEENEVPYNWAVILGGTNDLNGNREGENIYEALQKVWAYPLNNGTRVLALSVPECGFCSPELTQRRDTLNDLILDHEVENFYTLDLELKIPYWRMPEEKRKLIWDDSVHFTEKGYDLMGKIIGKRLVELIEEIEGISEMAEEPSKVELKRRRPRPLIETGQVEGRKLRSGRILIEEVKVTG